MDKPVVKVTWIDAQDHSEQWVHEDDATKFGGVDCPIISYGILISKTDKYVTLGADWDEADKNYGRVTKIPSLWITEIAELTLLPKPTET